LKRHSPLRTAVKVVMFGKYLALLLIVLFMSKKLRTFGVQNPDDYWKDRAKEGRTAKKRVHHFIHELCNELAPTNSKVLVCGVGDGHEFELCSKDYLTYGVEWSSEAISGYDFPTDTIIQADLNNGLPDFGTKFDIITISMVLHWLNEPETFLSNCKPSINENGGLVVIIPNITHYRYRIKYVFGEFPPISPSHKNFQTPAECEIMFEKAGFNIVKRTGIKPSFKSKYWPTVFATDIGYILKPK